jgi:bifunctional non-homologous end joining protein LigD
LATIEGDRHHYGVMGVTLSRPHKVLWPEDAASGPITKLDLARYYESVGPQMIPHLKGRPCSIIRAPDGIDGGHFFQRHPMAGSSTKFLRKAKVAGVTEPFIQIDRVEALAAMAQIAAVELHPWNCPPGQPEVPGRLIFDLDPASDVEFTAVIEAAREIRERLNDLGLLGFLKTTGGKGLHVVTPLAPLRGGEVTWQQAKAFARQVCSRMAADNPSRYLTKMTKKGKDRAHLPRLPAQRPFCVGCCPAVAADARRCASINADVVGSGAFPTRSKSVHPAHGAGVNSR